MILYADTSALVKLVVAEDGTEALQRNLPAFERVVASALAYVELRAAIAAAFRDRRLPARTRDEVAALVDEVWLAVSDVAVDTPLLRHAADLAESQRLRAYDAVHLASLRRVADPVDIVFACWDGDLRAAARRLGYRLLPRDLQ